MRLAALAFLTCVSLTSCSAQTGPAGAATGQTKIAGRQVVLVELFTSEGCSSCPPADDALAFLTKQPLDNIDIVTLALHVDYWDSRAWRDKFSSHDYSVRQAEYGSRFGLSDVYTPEMVVDGRTEFVGHDLKNAVNVVIEAAKNKKGIVSAVLDKDRLTARVLDLPEHEKATAYLAITEDRLVSNVKGGENEGRRFEHSSVVRNLRPVGVIDAAGNMLNIDESIRLEAGWKPENLKFILFVQEDKDRRIIAAGRVDRR